MPEMTNSGEHHRHSMLVGSCDHFFVPHGTARLDHGRDAGPARGVDAVAEWEEGVGGHHCAFDRKACIFGFPAADAS